ncbi:hypothetical protein Syun_020317 [Stephania yunnanensis]|uniref:Uncharacterized protein n=1 Tax=Stephania yunnanensis TaxID=152371 RepID=A0AAP0IE99_9MAGN
MPDSGVDELHAFVVAIDVGVAFESTGERVEEGQGFGERGLEESDDDEMRLMRKERRGEEGDGEVGVRDELIENGELVTSVI